MIAWYVGAVLTGLLFAWVIGSLFSLVVKPGSTAQLFGAVKSGIQALLLGEDDQFWPEYKKLMLSLFAYIGRQIGAVLLAFAPLVLALFFIWPGLMSLWESDAPWEVIPADAGLLVASATSERELLRDDGQVVVLPDEPGSVAICVPGSFSCLMLAGFGFHVVELQEGLRRADSPVIVRASHADWNPLWPYLADPEFLFFLSLSLGSIAFIVRQKESAAPVRESHEIGFIDNLLTQVATRNSGLLARVGNFETSMLESKLGNLTIDRPIFIAGLARSGTTILLEKLASLPAVATHRYRDFPFVMTPVYWNRYLRFAGGRQEAAERPHKDGIEITRDSPDAFEEPIWQHFFPGLHTPEKLHVLNNHTENAEFEKFYREHIKKILLIRSGQRYLSKGNYNLPRIEYISRIFPDAAFLIPVRHPLPHIQSLVHQQQLFLQYAEEDPNSPGYLRAVGHYEFGRQRQPINIAEGCAARILAAWRSGDEAHGYAIQWAEIYSYVAGLVASSPELAQRIRIVRFEDLCANPEKELSNLVAFTGFTEKAVGGALAAGIKAPKMSLQLSAEEIGNCWATVETVAALYGYTRNPSDITQFNSATLARGSS